MASKQPVISYINNLAVVIHLLVFILILSFLYLLGIKGYFLDGCLIYFLLMLSSRKVFAKHHRRGIKLYKDKRFREAIHEFEQSYQYFKQYNFIDKYRTVILFSTSKISYTEMALCNIAYCYSQIGEGKKSKEIYQKVLTENPKNEIANSAIKMFQSFENNG